MAASGSSPDWDAVLKDMVTAASGVAASNWGTAGNYATVEFKKLTVTGEQILEGCRDGSIPPQQGQILLDAQKHQSQAIIASVHLMNAVQAQAIINAAVSVLIAAINTAIGAIKFA